MFNKIDLLDSDHIEALKRRFPDAVFFSALTGEGLQDLQTRIAREAAASDALVSCEIPYREGALIAAIRKQGQVLSEAFSMIMSAWSAVFPHVSRRVYSHFERNSIVLSFDGRSH